MATSGRVDWDEIGDPLPIMPVPREKELRKAIFDKIDNNNNGYLTMTECIGGLPVLLEVSRGHRRKGGQYMVPLEDLRPAATAAFKMARGVAPPTSTSSKHRIEETCVDRREFHALLIAFKLYVELDVMYTKIDRSGDRMLHWKEIQPHVHLLEQWNITAKAAKSRFKDDWTPCLSFGDFADWVIMTAFRDNPNFLHLDENNPEETLRDAVLEGTKDEAKTTHAVVNAFKEWDTDKSGFISRGELAEVFIALDETFTKEMAEALFDLADTNKDGKIDYVEFSNWVTGKELETKDDQKE